MEKKRGLTTPNQKNVSRVLNRLNRMTIPYDSYTASVAGSKSKTGSRFDKVIGDKKVNVSKSQKLYESTGKGNQNRRLTRLVNYNTERTIGTNKGYKTYSGKLDTKKSDIVKDIKNFRTMGKIKKFTPIAILSTIFKAKKVADATLTKYKGSNN